jgi:Cd2+/Zn2+-exporting ATPase
MSESCCGHKHDDEPNHDPKAIKHDHEAAGHEHPESERCHEDDGGDCCDHDHEGGNQWQNRSLITASVITIAGLLCDHVLHFPEAWTIPAYVLGMVLGGWFLVPEAWNGLIRLRANINLLMVMASVGAAIIGAWGEAAVVVVLFGVAEWLEGFSVGRARGAISKLLDLAPPTARVRTNKGMVDKPVRDVGVGEIFEVRSGERIPLDAVVKEGESDVNQAPITGEPLPVDKKPGDMLFAGTLNGARVLVAEVTKPYKDSTLAKISEMVQGAQEQRAPTQRFVEKFALYYTPFVPLLSLLVFLIPVFVFHGDMKIWTYRALTILVIACPCALVVATPVALSVASPPWRGAAF